MSNYSKRRMVCVMPIEAVVGKMAPNDQKVSRNNAGFKCFVGYQRSGSVFNRYQVKAKWRTSPMGAAETAVQNKFKACVKATRARLLDAQQSAADKVAFAQQTRYKTLYQFVFNSEWAKLS